MKNPMFTVSTKIITKTEDARDFAQKREEHLKRLQELDEGRTNEYKECLHQRCQECFGTGRKADGSSCLHMISCPCPRCSPRF